LVENFEVFEEGAGVCLGKKLKINITDQLKSYKTNYRVSIPKGIEFLY